MDSDVVLLVVAAVPGGSGTPVGSGVLQGSRSYPVNDKKHILFIFASTLGSKFY